MSKHTTKTVVNVVRKSMIAGGLFAALSLTFPAPIAIAMAISTAAWL